MSTRERLGGGVLCVRVGRVIGGFQIDRSMRAILKQFLRRTKSIRQLKRGLKSARAAPFHDGRNRLKENLDIAPEGALLSISDVKRDARVIFDIAAATDLP